MDVRVGRRAQVVIPVEARRRLNLVEGDVLHVEIDDGGRLVLERVPRDPLERLEQAAGTLFTGTDPIEEQQRLRAELER